MSITNHERCVYEDEVHRGRALAGILLLALIGLFPSLLIYTDSFAQDKFNESILSIPSDADFHDYKNVITQFSKENQPGARNEFCVIGFSKNGEAKWAWVIWRQGKKIILWEPGQMNLSDTRRVIDLRKDVVASDADLRGSTYLVTRTWVNSLIEKCENFGTQVKVE